VTLRRLLQFIGLGSDLMTQHLEGFQKGLTVRRRLYEDSIGGRTRLG